MKKLLIFLLLFACTTANAQLVENAKIEKVQSSPSVGLKPAVTPFSLLDFSRIRWSNSYSVSYFSGGNSSSSVGVWNTSMFYDISTNFSLALNVGIAHNPGAIWGDANNSAEVLPSFLLNYHPSKNFQISIGMQTYRGNDGYGYGYGNPYYSSGMLHDSFLR